MTGDVKGKAKIWDTSGHPLDSFQLGSKPLLCVSFSKDDKSRAAGSYDSRLYYWTKENKIPSIFKGHFDQVLSVQFSEDNKSLVSSSRDNTAIIWDLNGAFSARLSG